MNFRMVQNWKLCFYCSLRKLTFLGSVYKPRWREIQVTSSGFAGNINPDFLRLLDVSLRKEEMGELNPELHVPV